MSSELDKVKELIEERKKFAAHKYGYWYIKLASEGSSFRDKDLEAAKMQLKYNHKEERYYGSDGYDPDEYNCEVIVNGQTVLAMSDDYVFIYIPGEWEKIVDAKYEVGNKKHNKEVEAEKRWKAGEADREAEKLKKQWKL